MPFLRVLLVILAVMAAAVAGLALFRPGPAVPPPRVDSQRPPPRPAAVAPPVRQDQPVMSPGDASSPAGMTAEEAEEAIRRLEHEREDGMTDAPELPPDLVRN